jgi:hypothetical protein
MTTAYTPILKLALPVQGELSGTWGDVVNNSITSMVEQAVAGLATVSTWVAASHTLTTADGSTSESRCAILECSGTPGAAATVVCPTATKLYVLKNGVSGGYAVTLKTSGGTGIAVPNGKVMWLYCDGTNVVDATTHLSSLTLSSALSVASGGTGAATLTGILKGNGTSAITAASAGTDYVTPTGSETLTNKTIAYASNTLTGVQPTLVSGTSIKTINSTSLLGSGDVAIAGMTYPNAGIPVSTGSAWTTSKTSPSGDIVGTSDSQTLTNKIVGDCTVDGTNTVGFRNIPQNSQSAAYTLVITDAGKHIYHPSADTTARTWTIPANASVAFPIGTAVTFVNDTSAGTVTISITSDTLVLSPNGTTGSRTLSAGGMATAIKVTSTRWLISGTGLT